MILNLGCGDDMYGDYRLDFNPGVAATHVLDLEKDKLPIQDNLITELRAYHSLEHIRDIIPLMREIFRVCVDGAKVDILLPYGTWFGAFADPTHVRFFNEESFEHFSNPELLARLMITNGRLDNLEITFPDSPDVFTIPGVMESINGFETGEIKDLKIPMGFARRHFMNTSVQMAVKAIVRK